MTIHLRSIALKHRELPNRFPFNLPVVKDLEELVFESSVTFLVGENGSGKSTILEAIACGIGSPTIGSTNVDRDPTLEAPRALAKHIRYVWNKRTNRGFFLRAEDFFNFTRRMVEMREELDEMSEEFEDELDGYGLMLAKGVASGQRSAIVDRYGENLDANSHGESFLKLFRQRFIPGGLYLLDEPEAPLSPLRLLSLISMLKVMVEEKSAQFIIATHSPILMSFPDATIFSFDRVPIEKIPYDEVEHVSLTRDFLNNPESFLRHL
jgi:predicted ATPase